MWIATYVCTRNAHARSHSTVGEKKKHVSLRTLSIRTGVHSIARGSTECRGYYFRPSLSSPATPPCFPNSPGVGPTQPPFRRAKIRAVPMIKKNKLIIIKKNKKY